MYRIGLIFVTVLAIVLGLLIGILNHDLVKVDLLWFQLDWPLGLLLLFALTIGLLVGVSLMWLFTVIPLRLQLRKARRTATGGSVVTDRIND
ncbi:MAG TPA: lipopolysaccharide assembly protein LapA domain-containing protein [Xanthomonadales bacterium]|nr:lipopolysaccharide assembly protein LapA domain-containing protein [Xanthomonadales bacterium]